MDELAERIEAALQRVLEHQVRGGFYGALDEEPVRGLVAADLEELGITVDRVRRIAIALGDEPDEALRIAGNIV